MLTINPIKHTVSYLIFKFVWPLIFQHDHIFTEKPVAHNRLHAYYKKIDFFSLLFPKSDFTALNIPLSGHFILIGCFVFIVSKK